MEIELKKIGKVDYGIDGSDEFVLLTRKDDELTEQQAHDWLLPKVYRDTTQVAGGYFCRSVLVVRQQYSTNTCICTIHHRYDV